MLFDCMHDLQQYVRMYFRISSGTETYLKLFPSILKKTTTTTKTQQLEESDHENIGVVNLDKDSETKCIFKLV